MTKFELSYNPFLHEKTFLVDGKPDDLPQCWGEGGEKNLAEWCGDFFGTLRSKYNDSKMEVRFKGLRRDFEFLSDARERHLKANPRDRIDLVDGGCVESADKLKDLRALFGKMQATAPFPELKSKELKALFDQTVSSEFEMAVVATMSSGKSTLINAMLGRELLPARNEATTATLARIHDRTGARGFAGVRFDKDGKQLEKTDALSKKIMERWNDDPKTSRIEIHGDVAGVESRDMQLVLTDTPGPNYCQTTEHRMHTLRLLKADYKPMVLYVLNSTQLKTDSDDELLKEVAEIMKTGGRQARDRFLFVLNKADEFDPEKKEPLEKEIRNVKEYLEKHGIQDARVFPASSRMAKVIRQHRNKDKLTTTEEDVILTQYDSFVRRDWKHFERFAPLSEPARERLGARLEEVRRKGDAYGEALIHTGIPAIELAISEYLDKYALPLKIEEGVRSFKSKIDSLGIEAETMRELKGSKTKREELGKNLAELDAILRKGEEGLKVREKIDAFSVQDDLKKALEKSRKDFMASLAPKFSGIKGTSVPVGTARESVKWLNHVLDEKRLRYCRDVETALENGFKKQVEGTIAEYRRYLEEQIGALPFRTSPEGILGASADITLDSTFFGYMKWVDVKVGSHRERRGFWRNFAHYLSFGLYDGSIEVPEFKPQQRVNMKDWLEHKVQPQIETFCNGIRKKAEDWAGEEEKKFKEYFKAKLAELENGYKKKISQKRKVLDDRALLEKAIDESGRKLEWLRSFKEELEHVLDLTGGK